ncbi:MAG: DNA repair protein RadC [Euryarchaeota archaeon]|nr:DNA repair protein RadC [Euryarchaeota archaeon]
MREYKLLDLPETERPRERLIKHGAENLSSAELLAILLRTGTKSNSILSLANMLLRKYNLKQLSQASLPELMSIQGIKKAKACQLLACFEIASRLASFSDALKPKVKTSSDVYAIVSPKLRSLKKECFIALYLDTKNQLLREDTISIGSLSANIVHPREVFKGAILESAAAVIIAHNHPSGDASPSNDDVELTKRLLSAGEIIGIKVLDHIIVGDGQFVSLKERGLM